MSNRVSTRFGHATPALSVLLGASLGMAIPFIVELPLRGVVAVLLGVTILVAIAISGHAKSLLLLFLLLSFSIGYNYHLTYIPIPMGVPDGLTIEVADLFIIALLALSLRDALVTKRRDLRLFAATTIPAILVLVFDVLSLRNSADLTLSLYGLIDHSRAFVVYLLIVNLVKTDKDFRVILIGIQLSGLFIGGICIVETLLKTNFTSHFTLEVQAEEEGFFRAAGFHSSTNTGGYLASLLPLIAVQLFVLKSQLARALTLTTIVITSIGLLLTITRGAWLSLALAIGPVIIILIRKQLIGIKHITLGLILIALLSIPIYHGISARISEGSNNLIARLNLFGTAIAMIKDKPINGIGVNTYAIELDRYEPDHVIHSFHTIVHNRYMLVWAETGIFGLIVFLWLLVAALTLCIRRANRPATTPATMTSIGLLGALLTSMVHMNLENYAGGNILLYVWFLIALSAIVGSRDRLPDAPIVRYKVDDRPRKNI